MIAGRSTGACGGGVPPGSAFLRPPADVDVEAILDSAPEALHAHDRVGPYEVLERIGVGGMGCVYRARRAQAPFEQEVAVKVIARHLVEVGPRSTMVRRFERERRILARLEHPGITRLIDGGTTERGEPYLVMELVRGEPIDRHAARLGLGLAARLALFRQVCAAVREAHRHLVIHRDIKPSNVLVTDEGLAGHQVKLLDFGASRWLRDGEPDSAQTETAGAAPLTLAYASPEQVRGEPASIASDVYSLGALLYQLLTGRPPHDMERAPRYDAMRRICEEQPKPPSVTAAGSSPHRSWAGSLRGDLDGIVLMALRPEPHRRYETVEQLDDEVRRHLERRPVRARGNAWGYRATTFVRRNRAATIAGGAAALAALTTMVAVGAGYLQTQRANRTARSERAAALEAEAASRRALEFFQTMLASSNPCRSGGHVTVVELLHEASRRIDDEVRRTPIVEAGVRVAIARTWVSLMRWDEALPHLERAEVILRHSRRDPLALADCLSLLGRARTHLHRGDAVAAQRESLAIRTLALGASHALVAESTGNLAFAMWANQRFEQPDEESCAAAERHYLHALALYERLGLARCRDMARFTMSLGCMYIRQERLPEAERRFDEALEIYGQLPAAEDQYEVTTLRLSAELLERTGRLDEALSRLRTCRTRLRPDLDGEFERLVDWRIADLATRVGGPAEGWREYALAMAGEFDRLAERITPPWPAAVPNPDPGPGPNRTDDERTRSFASRAPSPAVLRAAAWRLRADDDHAAAIAAAVDLVVDAEPAVHRRALAPSERWRGLAAFLESVQQSGSAIQAARIAALVEPGSAVGSG